MLETPSLQWVQYPVLDAAMVLRDAASDNASGADNQQERLSVDFIPLDVGNFLAGFALGEGSFMIVCRPRADYKRGWKLSAAFNVSQNDVTPLELFREQLGCGTIRKAGNDGWYLEVNALDDIRLSVIPFFRRFRLVGRKAVDFELFGAAVTILTKGALTDSDYREVLRLRELLNRGGKRRYNMERILRDYTPNSPLPVER
jgi:LAGLIDADG DNA endonuclease family protein